VLRRFQGNRREDEDLCSLALLLGLRVMVAVDLSYHPHHYFPIQGKVLIRRRKLVRVA
jgi:hypothetical protein